jgi:hypothetical protein
MAEMKAVQLLVSAAGVFASIAVVACWRHSEKAVSTLHTIGKTPLTWAPPTQTNPTILVIPDQANPAAFCLDHHRDYVIRIAGTMRGALVIEGGRHVVVVAGAIDQSVLTPGTGYWNSGIILRDRRGTTHLEGLHVFGQHLGDGIHMNSPHPDAILQLQNVRFDGVHSTMGEHADVWQLSNGGMREIRQDRVTATTFYKGYEIANVEIGPMPGCGTHPRWGDTLAHTRRVDIRNTNHIALENAKMNFDRKANTLSGFSRASQNVNGYLNRNIPVFLHEFYVAADDPSSITEFETAFRFHAGPNVSWKKPYTGLLSPDGLYMSWPDPQAEIHGVMRRGLPPGGDFVPASTVGRSYVPPGYLSTAER